MTQWQNPPQPGFSVDPAAAPSLRPSTADRDYADTTLRLAHADGRLSDAELAERVERAQSAWSLRDLSDVVADVSLPSVSSQTTGANLVALPNASIPPIVATLDPARRDAQRVLGQAVVSWLMLSILFNVIWLFTHGPGHYYWPIWPMLGTAVPLIGLVFARFGPEPRPLRRHEPPSDLR